VLEPVLPFVKSGHVKALGVVMAERAVQLPDMPTIGETVPGLAISGFNGVCAPSATPAPVSERLNAAIIKVMTTPAVRDRLIKSGSDILERPLPTPEFEAFVRREVLRWQKIVQDANVKVN
jgi:tripartite-type tricarboxylate transporter receptor subunit TctC